MEDERNKMHISKRLLRDRGKHMGGQKFLSLEIHGYGGTCRFSTKDIFSEGPNSEQVHIAPPHSVVMQLSDATQVIPHHCY